ncbi:MAG: YfhO family protein [Gemmatimonadaceae bacterium]
MHGDIFYPTAWLRWIMPVDLAITWGMALHFVLAGWFTYRFARALGLSWSASMVAGVAYELTGIVASQMSPGHDGKLFVSALAPLAFWLLLHAIRGQRTWAHGAFAIVVALAILGHYHMSYFLLIALGMWAVFLAFWDKDRPPALRPWKSLCLAALAVVVGVGITALQVVPFLEYIPYSPRAQGGPSTGWEFATSYAFPPSELFTLALPEFNGVLGNYWGQNALKFHTEYVGFLPLALAFLAFTDRKRGRLAAAFLMGAIVFLFFAFAGHTPFYRPFFEFLPLLNKIRAMGMVFYLVALPLSLLAGIGTDSLLSRSVSTKTIVAVTGAFALFGILGAAGVLQGLAEFLAIPERLDAAAANAPALRLGSLRLLLLVALGGAMLLATAIGRVSTRTATAGLLALIAVDLWSVDRQFYEFSPRAKTIFASDAVTSYLRRATQPFRVLDAGPSYGYSILMAYRIPIAMGYHGFELQRYDEFGGKDTGWNQLTSPNVLDLLAIRFLILPQAQSVPGYHQVVGETGTAFNTTAVLLERDTAPAYARVIRSVAKVPDGQTVPTLIDPRFPVNDALLVPDTSSAVATELKQPLPVSRVTAAVRVWEPGAMEIELKGADDAAGHLLVSENWYPDWHAEVDGKPATVRRADHTLLSVDIPQGAHEVRLWFDARSYFWGKVISAIALLLATALIIARGWP